MNNPFKEIQEDNKPPEKLRSRVLGSVENVKLALDLADLFLIVQPLIITSLFNDDKK